MKTAAKTAAAILAFYIAIVNITIDCFHNHHQVIKSHSACYSDDACNSAHKPVLSKIYNYSKSGCKCGSGHICLACLFLYNNNTNFCFYNNLYNSHLKTIEKITRLKSIFYKSVITNQSIPRAPPVA